METLFLGIFASSVITLLWFVACNDKSCKQRIQLINAIHKHNMRLIENTSPPWKTVSYEQPLSYFQWWWLLATFRDPIIRLPVTTQKLWYQHTIQ